MGDPSSEQQLLAGFWNIENGRWRWTAHRFALALMPPADANRTGATLKLELFIPPQQIEQLGPIRLAADVNETSLAPETYTHSGSFTYVRDIPQSLIRPYLLPIVFTVDKSLDSKRTDGRELGVIVTAASLDSRGARAGQ